jgi:hypothetical protein
MTREITIDLRDHDIHAVGYQTWIRQSDAHAALKALRACGLNIEDSVRVHPARAFLADLWVIARPWRDAELTLLMHENGTWAAGRLWDDTGRGAWWQHMPEIEPVAAQFTHITRTGNTANRREIYRTKSNGSCGRWTYSDDSFATCTCGWLSYTVNRAEARASARWHRTQMEQAAVEHAAQQQRARRGLRAARRAARAAN